MSRHRKLAWSAAILLLLLVAAISVPHLRQPSVDPQPADRASRLASVSPNAPSPATGASFGLVQPAAYTDKAGAAFEKKLIRNVELGLTVADVRTAAEQIRRLTEANGGEISNLEVTDSGGSVSATIVARVPASGLSTALAEYKKLAVRTDHEQVSARDVTREFYDNEAHLRNLRAEEQQYLTIMKQAQKVTDILEVSGKLSDVRDRIERLQAQIQVMTHDIQMSAVEINLTQQSDARILGLRWRPLYNAKVATRELLVGLGDWTDWVVEVVIKLPLILLWVGTVGGLLWVVVKIGRAAWIRFVKPRNSGTAQRPSSAPPASPTSLEPIA